MKEETVFYQKNGLTVTDVRLEYRNTMHLIRHVTMVQAYRHQANNVLPIILFIIGGIGCLSAFVEPLFLIGGILIVLGVLLLKNDTFGLEVGNAGGARQTIFVSREKDAPAQMREIKDAILQAISSLAQ